MFATLLALTVAHVPVAQAHHDFSIATYRGTFKDGATYLIQIPSGWNKTLVLYSHGYQAPGGSNPAYDVGDPVSANYLLSQGYALGGSSYATTGWAVAQALPDQIHVLDTFAHIQGKPHRTIAWGHSMGGLITAALVQQYPSRFDGALPMCGVLGGGVGFWNLELNGAFAINVLLGSSGLQVVNIASPQNNYNNAVVVLNNAQGSLQGQARIALAAALADTPGWYDPSSPQPAPTDFTTQEENQYLWFANANVLFDFYLRAELEGRAGGNPSFNVGVDYREQFEKSIDRTEVLALYKQAGLNLDADLKMLDSAPRIAAQPAALNYLSDNIIFDGKIPVPVLTLQTEGDGLVVDENDSAYELAVRGANKEARLRRLFIDRAGHCAFTPGEEIAAFLALVNRMDTGHWDGLSPAYLNEVATNLGSNFNYAPPSYATFDPAPFLRTYNGTPP